MVHLLVSTRYLCRHGNGCEVSELEIFLRFDGVPTLVWPSRSSTFFFAHLLGRSRILQYPSVYVRGLIFTCKCGSVIFSNMLDFAVYIQSTVGYMPSRRLRRLDNPLAICNLIGTRWLSILGAKLLCPLTSATV